MTIIVETNILLSACLNEESEIFKILNNLSDIIGFIIPDYALEEIEKNKLSICENTRRDINIFDQLLTQCCKNGTIISVSSIPTSTFELAAKLTQKTDLNDAPFVAVSLAYNALIWTGDIKLNRGLKRVGFNNIISTKELKDIIKGL